MIFVPSIWRWIAGVSVVAILAALLWWLSGEARRLARTLRLNRYRPDELAHLYSIRFFTTPSLNLSKPRPAEEPAHRSDLG
jgi:hypothetical protein